MRMAMWAVAGYMLAVGAATLASNAMADTPVLDTIAGLPSTGSFVGSHGVTAGVLDIGTAAAVWFFVLR